jgi:hypothetical protein
MAMNGADFPVPVHLVERLVVAIEKLAVAVERNAAAGEADVAQTEAMAHQQALAIESTQRIVKLREAEMMAYSTRNQEPQ